MITDKNTIKTIANLVTKLDNLTSEFIYSYGQGLTYQDAKAYNSQTLLQTLQDDLDNWHTYKPNLLKYLNTTNYHQDDYFDDHDFDKIENIAKIIPEIQKIPINDMQERLAFSYLLDLEKLLSQNYDAAIDNLIDLITENHYLHNKYYSSMNILEILN